MIFESDVFISYTHIDNQPLTSGDEGWITNLHRALEIRLAQLLGEKPKIWRDLKLQGNDYLDTAIFSQLPRTALLVSVITPRYLKSEWCRKELEEFSQLCERYGAIEVGKKSRIFKVVKTPVPIDRTPAQLQRMLGYEFFQLDPETGRPIEFRPEPGTGEARKYWAKMDDLAYDIFKLLDSLKTPASAAAGPAAAGPVVFLAETTFDLAAERDALRRELLERGYRVLPENPLPLAAEELEKALQKDLEPCVLSVHMVGERYGVVPDGAEVSMVDLQNQQAARQSREKGLRRIVWLSRENQPRDARQAAFLDKLRQDPAALAGAELLQTTLEDLKALIETRLRAPAEEEETEEEAAAATGEVARIYLICDRDDQEDARALDDYLFSQGYEVIPSLFEGDEATVRQDHQENLSLCDAAIIYYGKATEVWLRAKLRDFLKVAGYGRKQPLAARAVYIGEPARPDKERFRTHEAMVIRGSATVSGDDLRPFFAELEHHRKGGK